MKNHSINRTIISDLTKEMYVLVSPGILRSKMIFFFHSISNVSIHKHENNFRVIIFKLSLTYPSSPELCQWPVFGIKSISEKILKPAKKLKFYKILYFNFEILIVSYNSRKKKKSQKQKVLKVPRKYFWGQFMNNVRVPRERGYKESLHDLTSVEGLKVILT